MYSGGYKGAYSTGYACDMGKSSEKNTPAYHDPLVQQYAFILGENLRQLRKAQGLTQERLGLMIGTGHSRISNIERGRVVPSVPDMIKLCRALEADPVELVDTAAFKLSDFPEQASRAMRGFTPLPRAPPKLQLVHQALQFANESLRERHALADPFDELPRRCG